MRRFVITCGFIVALFAINGNTIHEAAALSAIEEPSHTHPSTSVYRDPSDDNQYQSADLLHTPTPVEIDAFAQQGYRYCLGRPQINLPIRDGVRGRFIGSFTPRTVRILRLEARQRDASGNYWYAFWYNFGIGAQNPRYGWSNGTQITLTSNLAVCNRLPRSPRIPAGLHLLYSALPNEVLAVGDAFGVQKGTDGSEALMIALKRQYPSTITVWRNLNLVDLGRWDCPPDWGQGNPVTSARRWWQAQYATWRARGLIQAGAIDYYEYRNECGFIGTWDAAFDREMVRLATAARVCLALFSDSYGTPEPYQFVTRRPVFDLVLSTECQPGKRHVVSLHTYGRVQSGQWLFGRWLMFRAALGSQYNALQYLFTEFGVTNAQGNIDGRGTPNCVTATQEIVEAVIEYKKHPEVLGFALFSVGSGTEWIDLTPCLPRIAQALRQLR